MALPPEHEHRIGSLAGDPKRLCYVRDELRRARADLFGDAENFDAVIHVVECLGSLLTAKDKALGYYEPAITAVAEWSPLATRVAQGIPHVHIPFRRLYDLVRVGRNKAVHEGAYARNLADHTMDLAIVLEDALTTNLERADEFMVRDPTAAELWQPVSFVRQQMLRSSFSFLPVLIREQEGEVWKLISDRAVARYLRTTPGEAGSSDRASRLTRTLGDAIEEGLQPEPVECRSPDAPVHEMAAALDHRPVLICDPAHPRRLLGILTAFDLL